MTARGAAAADGSGEGLSVEELCCPLRRRGDWLMRLVRQKVDREAIVSGGFGDSREVSGSTLGPLASTAAPPPRLGAWEIRTVQLSADVAGFEDVADPTRMPSTEGELVEPGWPVRHRDVARAPTPGRHELQAGEAGASAASKERAARRRAAGEACAAVGTTGPDASPRPARLVLLVPLLAGRHRGRSVNLPRSARPRYRDRPDRRRPPGGAGHWLEPHPYGPLDRLAGRIRATGRFGIWSPFVVGEQKPVAGTSSSRAETPAPTGSSGWASDVTAPPQNMEGASAPSRNRVRLLQARLPLRGVSGLAAYREDATVQAARP